MAVSVIVLLPFLLATTFGLVVAYLLTRSTDPKRAFLWAIVVGLVGGAIGPGLLSASILTSGWLAPSQAAAWWLPAWVTVSTFVLVPALATAVGTLGTRALARRRAHRVREG